MPVSYVTRIWVKRPGRTLTSSGAGGRGNADPGCASGLTVYSPAARRIVKRPLESERTVTCGDPLPAGWILSLAASGRGAHVGAGGLRSTGHVGPATMRPSIPERRMPPLAAPHAPSHRIMPITVARRIATA
jgi:hypothetical protein